ncbi:hypothetical protein EW145_g2023 [Phellinidium pouzarii]|uniref:Uncharacterized protein n=1 Tax=Phellinidium pouzarii TaxID=167371 RepID=A0A4S4LCM8_9AGAM|nr:hypothetical protein EW145_g2023 [Phellinidium pouzarii]
MKKEEILKALKETSRSALIRQAAFTLKRTIPPEQRPMKRGWGDINKSDAKEMQDASSSSRPTKIHRPTTSVPLPNEQE